MWISSMSVINCCSQILCFLDPYTSEWLDCHHRGSTLYRLPRPDYYEEVNIAESTKF